MTSASDASLVTPKAMMATTEWHPKGYSKLANLMGPYQEAAIFRRFGSFSALSLLSMQAELMELEAKWQVVCKRNDSWPDDEVKTLSCDFYAMKESSNGQWQLLEEIRKKTSEYHAMLLQASEVAKLEQPKKHNLQSLRSWLRGIQEGASFLQGWERDTWDKKHSRDFVTLHPTRSADGPLSEWVNPRLLGVYHWAWGRWHRRYVDRESGRVISYDDSKAVKAATAFGKVFATIVASLLPVLTIYVLNAVDTTITRIWITIGFTTFFGLVLAAFTSAQMKEIFAATAAFAAVEVVFIGSANGH